MFSTFTWVRIVSIAIFVSFIVLSAALWVYLARHMPFRYFGWFGVLTGTYIVVELVIVKCFAKKIQHNLFLRILVELVLGILFVATFYLFGAYVLPGTR